MNTLIIRDAVVEEFAKRDGCSVHKYLDFDFYSNSESNPIQKRLDEIFIESSSRIAIAYSKWKSQNKEIVRSCTEMPESLIFNAWNITKI